MTHILSPKTNRMIKVGGKSWRDLVSQGLLENQPIDMNSPNVLKSDIIKRKPLKERDARDNYYTRGKNTKDKDGNVVKKNIQVRRGKKQEDIAGYTAKCASRTIHKHIDVLSQKLEDAYADDDFSNDSLSEFETQVKNLILEEMLTGEASNEPNRYMNDNLRKKMESGKEAEQDNYSEYEAETDVEKESDSEYY